MLTDISCSDANDTLGEMLASVDEFVAKDTEEDLRDVVEKELQRSYNAKIKAFISKKTNASADSNTGKRNFKCRGNINIPIYTGE